MSRVVAFSGPRDLWVPHHVIELALNMAIGEKVYPDRVIVGGATGIDTCVAEYCLDVLGMCPRVYPAWWKFYDKYAGPIRSLEMIEDADLCIAICDPGRRTRGTAAFCDMAEKVGKLSNIVLPTTYRIMDERERNAHKRTVLDSYKVRRLEDLREARG